MRQIRLSSRGSAALPAVYAVYAVCAVGAASCASRPTPAPSPDAAASRAVHVNARLVGNDTTWVTRGTRYELVGRRVADVRAEAPRLDRLAAVFAKVFPHDTAATLTVDLRGVSADGNSFAPPAPLPADAPKPIVEIFLPPANSRGQSDASRGAPREMAGLAGLGAPALTLPATRGWLARHADANGHVAAWAEQLIPGLLEDTLVDRLTTVLAAHPEELIPLAAYFTMDRQSMIARGGEGRGRGSAPGETGGEGRGGGGGGGGSGGMGGMGGMGGRGGRGGMGGGARGAGGGSRGGSAGRTRGEGATPALQGEALFAAQSIVFGKYLAREGYDVIGALVDAPAAGKTLDEALTESRVMPIEQMEADWRAWLATRAAVVGRK